MKEVGAVDYASFRKGSIFFIALWILIFFSILSTALYKISSPLMKVAGALRERLVSQYLAKAAYIYAYAERQNDSSSYDTLYELRSPEEKDLGKGKFIYEFVDEESKVNINTASKSILMRLPGIDDELADEIIESEFRPFHFKEELLLVEDMSEEIFNGIKDYITVYGEGRVNLNTASGEILKILGMEGDLIGIIKDYRAGDDGEELTGDDRAFTSMDTLIEDLDSLGLLAGQEAFLIKLISENLIDVSSAYFSLHVSTEFLGQPAAKYTIVMHKEKVYQWREE